MRNKKVIITIATLIVLSLIAYLIYAATSPTDFPDDEHVISSMNELIHDADASRVLATIELDDRHVFVPYVSSNDQYGMSYWARSKFGWKLLRMDTRGEPNVWKLKPNDPSTHYLVWNINPKDQLSHVDYYLIRDRNYHITNKFQVYTPRVQLKTTVSMEEQSYGVLQLSEEWVNIWSEKLGPPYIGWIPYNVPGQSNFPDNSLNGRGITLGGIDVDFVRILNEAELELPE